MPAHNDTTIEGIISNVFAHRFVVETSNGAILADLTPRGAEKINLRKGDVVTLVGEQRPSELKVTSFIKSGQPAVLIHHEKHAHDPADPALAQRAATAQGYTVIAEPKRKPKHFEVLVRSRDGTHSELHIELDGHIRKEKPAHPDEPKWK